MSTQKNVLLGGLAGTLVGLLSLPVLKNVHALQGIPLVYEIAGALGLGLVTMLGIWVAVKIAYYIPVVLQIAKFVVVGALNTFVDFGVLNILILILNAWVPGFFALGTPYALVKGVSFIFSEFNSFLWNKFWTFGSDKREVRELFKFYAVGIGGFIINVTTATLVASLPGLGGFDTAIRANIGAAAGTFIALTWNFVGYKFFVFKR